ncbi:DNA helicase PcrA [Patescibacteria group bacterium]|nr:DNA helicase PcrA [Patescibacteria group bacterium]
MKNILKGLNDKQKEAVEAADGPLLILAGAGSGKTKTLTHRIAYIVHEKKVSPYNILAVTFTNKAAAEMKERIARLLGASAEEDINKSLPWMGTFHSVCVKILRKHIGQMGYKSSFIIYDSNDQLTAIKRVMKEQNIDVKQFNPRAVKAHISGAKNELMTPSQYQETAHLSYFGSIVSDVYKDYQKILKDNNALDFDDLIMITVQLLQKYPDVQTEYRQKFKYILIDEYQDTNHAQYILVKLFINKDENICVVGDDAQSIYSWRGATIRNILEFEKDYPKAKVIKLEQNYRSTKNILAAADEVIVKNKRQKKKKLWTKNPRGEKIVVHEASNELFEAQFVVNEINSLKNKEDLELKDFAVLYRTNAQSRSLEEVFLKNNIPYRIVGGVKFYERKEIKDALAYLQMIINPTDELSLERIINIPSRGISKKTVAALRVIGNEYSLRVWEVIGRIDNEDNGVKELAENHLNKRAINSLIKFYQMIDRWRNDLSGQRPNEFLMMVLEKSGYLTHVDDGSIEGETRKENLQELLTVLDKYNDFLADEGIGLFLEEIALITDIDNYNTNENAVTLMTLHSAKGLEFPAVFMVGMEENIFPHSRSITEPSEMEEERRLCYVGITRAKKCLYLTYTNMRRLFGHLQNNLPSRFIDDIPLDLVKSIKSGKENLASKILSSFKQSEPIVLDEDGGEYNSGDKVRHAKFGVGRVVQVTGGILKVAFEGQGVKSLAAAIAPLERL